MATKKLKGGSRHAHGCTTCHVRYEDPCEDPYTDGLCTACRGGRAWLLLIDNAAPKDCCRQLSRLATADEMDRYKLAGACLWWICRGCKRTHPYDDPKKTAQRKTD